MSEVANVAVATFAALAAALMLVTKIVEYRTALLKHKQEPRRANSSGSHPGLRPANQVSSPFPWFFFTWRLVRLVVMLYGLGLLYYVFTTADTAVVTRREFYRAILIALLVVLYALPGDRD